MHATVAEFLKWQGQEVCQRLMPCDDAKNGGIGKLETDIEEQVGVEEQEQKRRGAEVVEGVGLPLRHVAHTQEGEHHPGAQGAGCHAREQYEKPDGRYLYGAFDYAVPAPTAEEKETEPRQPGDDAHVQPRHTEEVQYTRVAELLDGGFVQVIPPAGEKCFGDALLTGCETARLYAMDHAALQLFRPSDDAVAVRRFGWQEGPLACSGKSLPADAFVQQVTAVVELVGVLRIVGQLWTDVQQQTVAVTQVCRGAVLG